MIGELDRERFRRICREVLTVSTSTESGGIGTLNEKRMHIALKRFICPDPECYEIDMGRRFVADIKTEDEIFEIQTASLYPLKAKLRYYLETTDCHITVVHPIAKKKYKIWIDPETGAASPRGRGGIGGDVQSELCELIYISEELASGRIAVWFLLIEEEEYRFLDGTDRTRKRHSTRYERLPVDLIDEVVLAEKSDYFALISEGLPDEFTAEEYRRASGGPRGKKLYMALGALTNIGILEPGTPRGRAKTWKKAE